MLGTNQQGSLDPRTRFNGRFIVEPVGCLHLNDGFTWGERRRGSQIPMIIDAVSLRLTLTFSTLGKTVGKLECLRFTLRHTGEDFRFIHRWQRFFNDFHSTSFFFSSRKQMPTPFREIPIIDRPLIKLADPTTSLSINTPANYTVVSPRYIHSSRVVYPCARIGRTPFFSTLSHQLRRSTFHARTERNGEREKGGKNRRELVSVYRVSRANPRDNVFHR